MRLLRLLHLDQSKGGINDVSGDYGGGRRTKDQTFWDEEALVDAVLTRCVGKTLKMRHPSNYGFAPNKNRRCVPRGTTILHLSTSLHNASIYGNRGLSSNVGSLSLPRTVSSSLCARLRTSGYCVSARNRDTIADTV